MFGDGSGGFSAPVMFPESNYGSFNGLALSHQAFALVEFRGAAGRRFQPGRGCPSRQVYFERSCRLSYDWSTVQCTKAKRSRTAAGGGTGR